jgi:hypothetical protein
MVAVLWLVNSGVVALSGPGYQRWEPRSEEAAAWFRQPIVLEKADANARRNLEQNEPLLRAGAFRFPQPMDDVILYPGRVRSRLEFGYGRQWAFDSGDRRWYSMEGAPPHDRVLGLTDEHRPVSISTLILTVPAGLGFDGAPDRTGTLHAEVTLDAYRYRQAAELAVREGAWARTDGYGLLVSEVKVAEPGELIVRLLVSRLVGTKPTPEPTQPFGFALRPGPDDEPLRVTQTTTGALSRLVVVWPPMLQTVHTLVLDAETAHRLGIRDPDSARLAGARLLVSAASYAGSVTREFTVEDFDPRQW